MTTTYLGSGDASKHRRDYQPEWLDNLADDVTMEGSVLTGIAEGPEAIRAMPTTVTVSPPLPKAMSKGECPLRLRLNSGAAHHIKRF